jgi:hypothetical protein
MEEMNLSEFRQDLFEFCCGGRLSGMWGELEQEISEADMLHVCSHHDVRERAIEWPRTHPYDFDEKCHLASNFANGDIKKATNNMVAYLKKQQNSTNREVELSGIVDTSGLTPKASKRYARDTTNRVECFAGNKRRPEWTSTV